MRLKEKLIGEKFNKLTVIEDSGERYNGNIIWKCLCDCGNLHLVKSSNLKNGRTKSCGCGRKEFYKNNRKSNKIELEGKKFGRLTVICDSGIRKNRMVVWECLCDCGNKHYITTTALTVSGTKSCGCLQREIAGKQSNLEIGEASKRKEYYAYKQSAKRRKIDFKLSFEDFVKICEQDCFYCGSEPIQIRKYTYTEKYKNSKFAIDWIHNGLDRFKNECGYENENVVPCCKICNYMKQTMSYDEFKKHIIKIYHKNFLK